MHLNYHFYSKAYDYLFNGRREEIPELAAQMGISPEDVKETFADTTRNTSISDYVWLPLRFEGDMVYIDWKDEWKLEDYE